MKEIHQFWMVWSPQGRAPTYRHDTWESAVNEARRLARTVPGNEFYVLHSVRGFVMPIPDPQEISIDVSDLPF